MYVRGKYTTDAADTVLYVGVGDVYVIYGQSNASGRATNSQTWAHPTLKAAMFGNDYSWQELADPIDNGIGQIDAVSNDGASAKGTVWPIVADSIMANQGVPVAFVPCAIGGKNILPFIPNLNYYSRSTLYGSMYFRADSVQGIKAVLWWQGEYDARDSLSFASYNSRFDSLANSINRDLGVKIMPCLLQNSQALEDAKEDTIRLATSQAWSDNANVFEGPDFSDITSDDTYHLMTDAKIDSAANRWWRKIRDNIYAP